MEMKDSGIYWAGKIPATWKVVNNKYVMTKIKDIQPHYDNETILSLSMDGVIKRDFSKGGKIPKSFDGYQKLYKGNLLLCLFDIDVTPRCVGIINNDGLTSPAYSQFVLNSGYYLNYFYYLYLLLDFSKELVHFTKTLRYSLTEEQLGDFKVVVPPYEEQKLISKFLDRALARIDNLILKTKKSISNLQDYKQSLITKAVTKGLDPNVEMKDSGVEWIGKIPNTWNISKIKYIAQLNPSIKHSLLSDSSQVTFTPMEYIKNGYFINNSCEYSAVRKCSYTAYLEGDIAIAKVTPCFENGNIAIMKGLESSIGFGSSELFILRATNILTEYLFYFLQNDNFKAQCVLSFSGASGLKRVSGFFLNNCPITVPPIEIQLDIINFLNKKIKKINELISTKHKLINKLEDYKKSLIFEYVTGKKTVGEN